MSVSAQRGLIPTHAGKTGYEAKVSFAQPAHPHSRGENPLRGREKLGGRGSSPLTRGKRTLSDLDRLAAGLIPTHAGKTRLMVSDPHGRRAHPHSRGENSKALCRASRAMGSSPLTRGKLGLHMSLIWDIRLIPTHAGKTKDQAHALLRDRAHPHSRGENPPCVVITEATPGSSPLTRGKRRPIRRGWLRRGLIPTHAGKTCALARVSQRGEAHPHSRGENVGRLVLMRTHPGSSPLTRGKPLRTGTRAVRLRLIPTHAGKTPSVAVRRGTARAHPHSRGENRVHASRFHRD